MENLKTIKDVLKIIISLLIISAMVKSCSNAYTWEEFVDYCSLIATGKISSQNNSQKYGAEYVVSNKNRIESQISVNNYNSFIVAYSSYYYLQFYTGNVSVNSGTTLRTTGGTMGKSCKMSNGSSISEVGNTDWINAFSCKTNTAVGLLDSGNWNSTDGRSNKQYFYLSILPRTNLTTENLPWYIADAYSGSTYTNVSFEIQDVSNNNVSGDLDIITHEVNMGTQYQILIESTENLINGEDYHIVMRNGSTPIYQTEDFTLEWEDLTPTPTPPPNNPSGDTGICMCGPYLIMINDTFNNFSGELIPLIKTNNDNLSQVVSQIQNNNKAIEELNKNMFGSGESGEKNFFQKTYEELFTLKSGDVQEIIENATQNLKIESGEISGDLMIINFLKGEPGDFKITWGNYTPNFTIKNNRVSFQQDFIPSGEVNFSQLERENESLHNAMIWVRTITTFSIISLIIHESWIILMSMLGVGTEIYGRKLEEKEQLAKQQERENTKIRNQIFNANQERIREYNRMAKKRGWTK